MFSNQKTIKNQISFSGVGLHSGKIAEIILIPQGLNTGINFFFKNKKIKASWKNAIVSQLCTKLKHDALYISTIEHLMSALSGAGVTNLLIKISGSEVPILDGSAKEFFEKILLDGLENQKKEKNT